MATRAPALPIARTIAAPIPRLAPVTSTLVLPRSIFMRESPQSLSPDRERYYRAPGGAEMHRRELAIRTNGRSFIELTKDLASAVIDSGIADGMCNVFVPHTSASLLAGENWDPSVRRDLEAFMSRLAPDGDPRYEHDAEGPDDMPAHIRTMLTQSSIVIPIGGGKLQLGTWQGIYLWEHRTTAHDRRIIVTVW